LADTGEEDPADHLQTGGGAGMTAKKKPGPRHDQRCSVCLHADRVEIDADFVNWTGPGRIAKKYHISRDALYRHAHATNLMERRQRNVRQALEKIIEYADQVKPNAAAVIAAAAAYSRLNSRGELIERTQTVNLNQLFNRMTKAELDNYAKTGALPDWFEETLSATGADNYGGRNGG
jgi:hypothetical protein